MPSVTPSRRFSRYRSHHRIVRLWTVAIVGITLSGLLDPDVFAGSPRTTVRNEASESCAVVTVHDGDTLTLSCGFRPFVRKVKVRLHCIDAPEMGQKPWGKAARSYLRKLAPKGARVTVLSRDSDRYGREVAVITRAGRNLNLEMVRSGKAVTYDRYCSERIYHRAEADARRSGLGVWTTPGTHQTPWAYRH